MIDKALASHKISKPQQSKVVFLLMKACKKQKRRTARNDPDLGSRRHDHHSNTF